jgi:tetratricopeptide (TPR) repeat protein
MDALAGLRPEDWWFPRQRHRPRARLSPEMRTWLSTLLLAVAAGLVVLFLVWSTMQAYREFQRTQTRASAIKHADAGWRAYKGKQFELAIAEFERAAQFDPSSSVGRTARLNGAHVAAEYGQMLEGNGNLGEARRSYERAIRLESSYALAHQWLARVVAQQDDDARAEFLWQRAIALATAQSQQSGLTDDQRKEAAAVIDQAPREWGNFLLQRALQRRYAGRIQEARDLFQRVIEVAPGTDAAATAQQWLDQLPSIPGMRTSP